MSKILLVVTKNTAVLDFALPLLHSIREKEPRAEISVLYCTISKRSILRQSTYYSAELGTDNVHEFDLADYLPFPLGLLKGLWRLILSRSRKDSFLISTFAERIPGCKLCIKLLRKSEKWVEMLLAKHIGYELIFENLTPSVILLDNTIVQTAYKKELLRRIKQHRTKTILLPHAPHHSSTTSFTPFEESDPLPDFCRYWMPFMADTSWEALPEKKSQFAYVGYPGLDTAWLAYIQRNRVKSGESAPIRCLLLIRPFLPEGHPDTPGPFVYTYDEFFVLMQRIAEVTKQSTVPLELIVKPHPSNNYHETQNVLKKLNVDWCITYEPIYALLRKIDCALSLYSTTLLIPVAANIPVMLVHSSAQDEVHKCPAFKSLYSGLRHYLQKSEDLTERFPMFMQAVQEKHAGIVQEADSLHVRSFFPDGSAGRCLEQLHT